MCVRARAATPVAARLLAALHLHMHEHDQGPQAGLGLRQIVVVVDSSIDIRPRPYKTSTMRQPFNCLYCAAALRDFNTVEL